MTEQTAAFIGLGVMGYPMAGHLQKAGIQTKVYNRTQTKAKQWTQAYAGQMATTAKLAAQDAKICMVCVGNDQDVASVVLGEQGALSGMQPGSILVDHTTTSAQLALEIAKACQQKGIAFIDAPVSGGQAGAENGKLTIMCGGHDKDFQIAQAYFQHYAQHAQLMGSHGQGQRTKMVNQILIAGILQGLSEGLLLAQACQLDIPTLVETLKHGAAGSWQLANRGNTMAKGQFDFGFAIDWMRKDLGFCLEEAKLKQLKLPLIEQVDARYQLCQQLGLGRMDTSALIEALKKEV